MTLRLAVAGAGVIGRAHAQRIRAHAGCRLVGLADPAPAAAALAAALDAPLFAGLPALLAAVRPDGVILATPNAHHVQGALQCLAAGVPVLVEKPVAVDAAEAQRLVDAERAFGVPVLVGHHRRHSAVMAAACEAIASGRLGRLVAATASATFVKPDAYFREARWRTQPGGGPILINGVHEVDNLRALLAPQAGEVVAVQAMASNATRCHAVEDTVVCGLRFASGLLASLVLSDTAANPRSWEHTSGENPVYDHHADQDCCVVMGTRGSLQVPTLNTYHYDGEASWTAALQRESLPAAVHDPLELQLAHFCAVIRREAAPLVSATDAMQTLRVTLAIAEAARGERTVTLA